jgi:molybdate transport system permease protein
VLLLAGVALLFLTLPIFALGVRAIQNRAWDAAASDTVSDAIALSLLTTSLTLLLALVFGTPLAYALARYRLPFKRAIHVLIELPIVLPPAVAGLALLLALGRRGILGGALSEIGVSIPFTTAAVIVAQTFIAAPFYIRTAQLGFQSIPPELEDAARVDGASEWQVFRRVTLPLSARALSAGLVLCWARALGEFGATILFAGSLQGRTQTMPLLIYNLFERDLDAAIWTGVLLIGLAALALLISQRLSQPLRTPTDEAS